MIQVGDYVKIQKKRYRQIWYNDETYQVIDVIPTKTERTILVLDKTFFTDTEGTDLITFRNHNQIYDNFVDVDVTYTRIKKINSILND